MTPGVAPPYRAAAACPNSWKPADTTVTTNTRMSSPGRSNASYAADARPFRKNTHQHTTVNARSRATTIQGRKRNRNGSVSRRVRSGSVTAYRKRRASRGFRFFISGLLPSVSTRSPRGRSLALTKWRTFPR